jgi:hypothetical protein
MSWPHPVDPVHTEPAITRFDPDIVDKMFAPRRDIQEPRPDLALAIVRGYKAGGFDGATPSSMV